MAHRVPVLAAVALATSGLAGPASALAFPNVLGNLNGTDDRRKTTPPVARYVSEDGSRFVLDRTTSPVLMKFDNSPELWVLYPSRGPRGDIIYRIDSGEPVIRVTNLGGATLYFGARSGGTPVALAGVAPTLRLQNLNAQALLQKLAQASVRASRAAGRLIVFDAPDVTQGSEAVYADAAAVSAEAISAIAQRKNGKQVAKRISRIQLVQTRKVEARLAGDILVVSIDPRKGVAGRPSSRRIVGAVK